MYISCIHYIPKLTGHDMAELLELAHNRVDSSTATQFEKVRKTELATLLGVCSEHRAGGRYRSTAVATGHPAAAAPQHGAQQQTRAVSL